MTKMDEVKLTSYALGELQGKEAKEVEEMLASSPEARAFVEEMKRLGSSLGQELQKEALPKDARKSQVRTHRSNENTIAIASAVCVGLVLFFYEGREKYLGFLARILGNPDYKTEQMLSDSANQQTHFSAGFNLKHALLILGVALVIYFVVKKILANRKDE